MNNPTYLHIWGQYKWHDPIIMIATKETLRRLKMAIEEAIEKGESKIQTLYTGDGEKFSLFIACKEDNWDNRALPYSDEIAREQNHDAIMPFDEIKQI